MLGLVRGKTADRKVAGLQRCAEPVSVIPGPSLYSTVQYSTVQNSTVQDPHCLRSGVHQVHDCFSIGQTRALDSSSFALELCTKLELIKFKFILEPLFNEKMTVCLPYQV